LRTAHPKAIEESSQIHLVSFAVHVSLLLAVLAGIWKDHTTLVPCASGKPHGKGHKDMPGFLSHRSRLQHGEEYGGRVFLCEGNLAYLHKFDIGIHHAAVLFHAECSKMP